jgi:hypothetical protein
MLALIRIQLKDMNAAYGLDYSALISINNHRPRGRRCVTWELKAGSPAGSPPASGFSVVNWGRRTSSVSSVTSWPLGPACPAHTLTHTPAGEREQALNQCSGSMIFWSGSGSGSANPRLWLMDPDSDPAFFVIDLQDANKKEFFFKHFFCLLLFEVIFT